MRIGIDIDGVLTDIEKWQLDYGSKFYFEKYKMEIVNSNAYTTKDIFNAESKLDYEFWTKYFKEYSINVNVRKFASEVINTLRQEDNEIYIITARGNFLRQAPNVMSIEESKNIVLNWLKKNNIQYDNIIFSPEDKLKICINNNIDIMIEDKVENINKLSTIIPVICFNAGYNKQCNGKNIIRCYSWYDIYSKISKLSKN